MIILGLNLEEACSAALMIDGVIVAAVSEERFVRKKNYSGFPINSINFCLDLSSIKIEDVDIIGIQGLHVTLNAIKYSYVQRRSNFSVLDYVKEEKEYWCPIIYENKSIDYLDVFKDKICLDTFNSNFNDFFFKEYKNCKNIDSYQNMIRQMVISYFPQVSREKIQFASHHDCHALYGYYGCSNIDISVPYLIVVIDSWGDYENATVFKMYDNKLTLLYRSDNNNFGKLYRNMTVYLGMKPYEHEYKVMGLASYVSDEIFNPASKIFDDTMSVDGINFVYKNKPQDYYLWFKEKLDGIRFDYISRGLQDYIEKKIKTWLNNIIDEFGINNIIFSGGVAMNIKLNMRLSQLNSVNKFFVPGSADDSSNCIGVCFYFNNKNGKETSFLKNLYLGQNISDSEVYKEIDNYRLREEYKIIENISSSQISDKLSEGKIIARCAGRMEFGARALGNRSILADPRDLKVVDKINKVVKKRDFWMPFAPTIIDICWNEYLDNEKNIFSPYMTTGFNTTKIGENCLCAAVHRADKTSRPQMLTRDQNEDFYDIIKSFYSKTGVGAVLNTSFNLHGFPIVRNCNDAIDVFLNSDIDGLLLNNVYIEK